MPQAAEGEGDEQVKVPPPFPRPAASQGDIDIIPEPGHERDMPPPPEFGDRSRVKGPVEVIHQAETHDLGRTDRNIRIAGKIAIDLKSKEESPRDQRKPGILGGAAEDLLHHDGQFICDHHLLKKPQTMSFNPLVMRPGSKECVS